VKGPSPARAFAKLGSAFLPFADVATPELPLPRLLRLSLFQVTVGMAAALIIGTLNRVMIVELHVHAWIVSVMVSLPLLLAPARAVIGFKSDQHQSAFGWKRVPYIWFGTLIQFGGLSIMPFALIILSGDSHAPAIIGPIAAGLAFLLVGAGMHTVQTAGLALATDLAPPEARPRVVGMLCVMLLVGMMAGALGFGALLAHFSEVKLIGVVQEAALITLVLNGIALWKQEPRGRKIIVENAPSLSEAWTAFRAQKQSTRRLLTIGLGTIGFSMQDILLEPYGGQVLHLSVGQTTSLTAMLALGGVSGFALAGRYLARNADPYRIAASGVLAGIIAFALVIFSAPLATPPMFVAGVGLIGFGAGLFLVGTLADAMSRAAGGMNGLALGAWGAVQAVAAGSAIALGGIIRDAVAAFGAGNITLGAPAAGYACVYGLEIALLFATLVALGPLVRQASAGSSASPEAASRLVSGSVV
jgi:BCD family chlorophyll transporter-like MFS transporter